MLIVNAATKILSSIQDARTPKCGAKMQRVYKRTGSTFVSCGWICTECGLIKAQN